MVFPRRPLQSTVLPPALIAATLLQLGAQQPATRPGLSPVFPLPANRPVPPQGPGSPLGNVPANLSDLPPPPPAAPAGRVPDDYPIAPEAEDREAGVPAGRVESFEFSDSRVFPGTSRAVWVYVPAQYNPGTPASLMVFQDGHAYVSTNGRMRVPIVFDNLIARREMPVTVGVFVNPGHRGTNAPPANGWGNRNNRSVEYDSLGADYARFLTEELLPAITNRYQLNLSTDPADRAIAGMSSGGICAFTAAWERPDQFGRVLSHIGSFVDIRGGHVYPALLRRNPRKPIRVFLQEGSNDLNNTHGDWPLGNLQLAGSLAFMGYDHRLVLGDGAHNDRHGAAILPDSLRWLWKKATPPATTPGDLPGSWELVSEGHSFTDAACTGPDGTFYFADLPKAEVWRVPAGGKPERWLAEGLKLSGMKFGPDGLLYAASQGGPGEQKPRIVAINPATRTVETIVDNVRPNDLVVTRDGRILFTDTGAGQVLSVPTAARKISGARPVAGGFNAPNGIALSPDGGSVFVSEYQGTNVWLLRLPPSNDQVGLFRRIPIPGTPTPTINSLLGVERFATLTVPADKKSSGGDGSSTQGNRTYVTSHAGIQVFDHLGNPAGLIPNPQPQSTPVSCTWAGTGHADLFICDGPRVWRRRLP